MTVRRRIIFKNVVLLGCLLLMGAASGAGLLLMRHDMHVAIDEYNESRMIQNVMVLASELKFHLATDPDNSDKIRELLDSGIAELESFCKLQAADGAAKPHDAAERMQATQVLGEFVVLKHQYSGKATTPSTTKAAQLAALDRALVSLQGLHKEMDGLIKCNQQVVCGRLQLALWIIGGLAATIVVAGVFISRSHYLSIARPVYALREGVRRLAAARFSDRLETEGDREFAELAEDFNRMAAELDDFYRRLEEKVEQKSRDLVRSERLASVGFLAAGVAHEMNNPLGIISGHAELALRRLEKTEGQPAPKQVGDALGVIREEAFRCKEVTERLLALVRPGHAHREAVSMAMIASDTANLVNGLEQYRGRMVRVFVPEGEPLTANVSGTEMRQVLLNLVVNALDAAEPETGRVTIEGRADGEWIEIAVSDNGHGMAPDVLERVFEPLFTARRGTGSPGTGLGLSISHLIVESHGGTIQAASDGPGKGSRFVVRLPAASRLQETVV